MNKSVRRWKAVQPLADLYKMLEERRPAHIYINSGQDGDYPSLSLLDDGHSVRPDICKVVPEGDRGLALVRELGTRLRKIHHKQMELYEMIQDLDPVFDQMQWLKDRAT